VRVVFIRILEAMDYGMSLLPLPSTGRELPDILTRFAPLNQTGTPTLVGSNSRITHFCRLKSAFRSQGSGAGIKGEVSLAPFGYSSIHLASLAIGGRLRKVTEGYGSIFHNRPRCRARHSALRTPHSALRQEPPQPVVFAVQPPTILGTKTAPFFAVSDSGSVDSQPLASKWEPLLVPCLSQREGSSSTAGKRLRMYLFLLVGETL
jgi:hypothetical protein